MSDKPSVREAAEKEAKQQFEASSQRTEAASVKRVLRQADQLVHRAESLKKKAKAVSSPREAGDLIEKAAECLKTAEMLRESVLGAKAGGGEADKLKEQTQQSDGGQDSSQPEMEADDGGQDSSQPETGADRGERVRDVARQGEESSRLEASSADEGRRDVTGRSGKLTAKGQDSGDRGDGVRLIETRSPAGSGEERGRGGRELDRPGATRSARAASDEKSETADRRRSRAGREGVVTSRKDGGQRDVTNREQAARGPATRDAGKRMRSPATASADKSGERIRGRGRQVDRAADRARASAARPDDAQPAGADDPSESFAQVTGELREDARSDDAQPAGADDREAAKSFAELMRHLRQLAQLAESQKGQDSAQQGLESDYEAASRAGTDSKGRNRGEGSRHTVIEQKAVFAPDGSSADGEQGHLTPSESPTADEAVTDSQKNIWKANIHGMTDEKLQEELREFEGRGRDKAPTAKDETYGRYLLRERDERSDRRLILSARDITLGQLGQTLDDLEPRVRGSERLRHSYELLKELYEERVNVELYRWASGLSVRERFQARDQLRPYVQARDLAAVRIDDAIQRAERTHTEIMQTASRVAREKQREEFNRTYPLLRGEFLTSYIMWRTNDPDLAGLLGGLWQVLGTAAEVRNVKQARSASDRSGRTGEPRLRARTKGDTTRSKNAGRPRLEASPPMPPESELSPRESGAAERMKTDATRSRTSAATDKNARATDKAKPTRKDSEPARPDRERPARKGAEPSDEQRAIKTSHAKDGARTRRPGDSKRQKADSRDEVRSKSAQEYVDKLGPRPEKLTGEALGKRVRDVKEQARKIDPRDPESLEQLRQLYRRQPDEVLGKLKNRDAMAKSIYDQRIPPNFELADALTRNKRSPHEASAIYRDRNGTVRWMDNLKSGNPTAEERARRFPERSLSTHTERRALKEAPLRRGGELSIIGQYDPCVACQTAMKEASQRSGATIRYWWPGGEFLAKNGNGQLTLRAK